MNHGIRYSALYHYYGSLRQQIRRKDISLFYIKETYDNSSTVIITSHNHISTNNARAFIYINDIYFKSKKKKALYYWLKSKSTLRSKSELQFTLDEYIEN